jgi:pSer/pThr/pTyr-binding forkhead associated (FHA) protein
MRSGTDVQMRSEHTAVPPGSELVLRLVQKDGQFWVDKAAPSSSSKKLWLVVRDLATSSHRLSEGDVIKLGRFKFRVRQMTSSADVQPELRLDDNLTVCKANLDKMSELENTLCRICLLEGSSEDDPLIRPCMCKGSIEYVHLGCLRHWVKGRLNLSDNAGGSYFYRPLPCELCKAPYPAYVEMGQDQFPLVEVPKTTPPFIVLENMVRDTSLHQSRGLHVISLAENKLLKLGRGHESDVRIADVSISRCHATIRAREGCFFLEDNNSKFGTLVAMKKPRTLAPGSAISIQVGRTVLSLSLTPNAEVGDRAAMPSQQPPQLFHDENMMEDDPGAS